VCDFENGGLRLAGDQAVLIHFVPGGYQQIDLSGVGKEGAYGVWIGTQIKERNGLGPGAGCGQNQSNKQTGPSKQSGPTLHKNLPFFYARRYRRGRK
jgi:hypothetical protein